MHLKLVSHLYYGLSMAPSIKIHIKFVLPKLTLFDAEILMGQKTACDKLLFRVLIVTYLQSIHRIG